MTSVARRSREPVARAFFFYHRRRLETASSGGVGRGAFPSEKSPSARTSAGSSPSPAQQGPLSARTAGSERVRALYPPFSALERPSRSARKILTRMDAELRAELRSEPSIDPITWAGDPALSDEDEAECRVCRGEAVRSYVALYVDVG